MARSKKTRSHKKFNTNKKNAQKRKTKNNLTQLMKKINKKISNERFYKKKAKSEFKKDILNQIKKNNLQNNIEKQEKTNIKKESSFKKETKNKNHIDIIQYDFNKLIISENTLKSINLMGFKKMTEIQARTIPLLLSKKNLIGAAKTGSGKTLAFLIPVIENLNSIKFTQKEGTGGIIISPTRELALQIYGVLKKLCENHKSLTFSIVMGGCNKKTEADKLKKNVNIIVGTPGRLLDHLKNTDFKITNLKMLVIDEADRILDNGFEDEMKQIISLLPTERQTALFSATQTDKTKDLEKISFNSKPIYIGVDDSKEFATRSGLSQGYVKISPEKKFLLLFTFLKKNQNKKILVFFSTCDTTKFFSDLLNYVDVPVMQLHGKLKQNKRTSTYFEFVNSDFGTLLCTDVAARGLDIPSVDWIIQYDPPNDPKAYIHRVGRTARGIDGTGKALIFLLPEEIKYIEELKELKVPVKEFEFPNEKLLDIQLKLEELISNNYYLSISARSAYKSYVQSYSQMTNKDIFNVHFLDLFLIAKSFGFDIPPKVSLNIKLGGKKTRKRLQNSQIGKIKKFGNSCTQFSR